MWLSNSVVECKPLSTIYFESKTHTSCLYFILYSLIFYIVYLFICLTLPCVWLLSQSMSFKNLWQRWLKFVGIHYLVSTNYFLCLINALAMGTFLPANLTSFIMFQLLCWRIPWNSFHNFTRISLNYAPHAILLAEFPSSVQI